MSSVSDTLGRLENEHQEILDNLHSIRLKEDIEDGDIRLLEDIEELVDDWDRILGGQIASDTIGAKVSEVKNSSDKHDKLIELDLLLDPLRHYVIALEKYQLEEFRETVTRSGMVIERISKELAIELDVEVDGKTYEEIFGILQNALEASGIERAKEFVSELRAIYSIRNDRGPHDVPAAALIQAKRSLAMLMWIYYRYLQIISQIGTTELSDGDVEKFTNLLDIILEFRPRLVMGEGGGDPSIKDIIVNDLYRNGFFQTPRTLGEIMEELHSKRYNPVKSTVASNLLRLKNDILSRKGKQGNYKYVEKLPPEEYFS